MANKFTHQQLRHFVRNTILRENEEALPSAESATSIDGKYATKKAIINAVYDTLKRAKVEGRYHDDNWQGVKRLANALADAGIDYSLQKSNYTGHNSLYSDSNLPTKKEYKYFLQIKDRNGKDVHLPLKVICAFVGKTGTMEDDVYELTYNIEA
jgi:hypothetical protein